MYYVNAFRYQALDEDRWLVFLPDGVNEWTGPRVGPFLKAIAPFANRIVSEQDPELEAVGVTREDLAFAFEEGLLARSRIANTIGFNISIIAPDPALFQPVADWLKTLCFQVHLGSAPRPNGAADYLLIHYEDPPQPSREITRALEWYARCEIFQGLFRLDRFLYLENPHIPSLANPDRRDTWAWLRRQYAMQEGREDTLFDLVRESPQPVPLATGPRPFDGEAVRLQLFHRLRRLFGLDFQSFHIDQVNQIQAHDLYTQRDFTYPARHYAHTEGEPFFSPWVA